MVLKSRNEWGAEEEDGTSCRPGLEIAKLYNPDMRSLALATTYAGAALRTSVALGQLPRPPKARRENEK